MLNDDLYLTHLGDLKDAASSCDRCIEVRRYNGFSRIALHRPFELSVY